jgi:hypothetical protein
MDAMGSHWWLYVWLVWLGFNLLALFLYPTLIAPLFNKFTPLADAALKERIEALLARCGFRARACSSWTARSARPTATPTSPASARPSASSSSTPCWKSSRRRNRGGAGARARPLPPRHVMEAHRVLALASLGLPLAARPG